MNNARAHQLEIFRRMQPAERLHLAMRLYWSARDLKTAFLRQKYPEWSEQKLKDEVRRIFLHART